MDSHRQCGIVTWTFTPHIMLWTLTVHGSKWIRGYHDRIGVNYINMGWYPEILEVTLRPRNRTCRGRQWQPGEDIVDGLIRLNFVSAPHLFSFPQFPVSLCGKLSLFYVVASLIYVSFWSSSAILWVSEIVNNERKSDCLRTLSESIERSDMWEPIRELDLRPARVLYVVMWWVMADYLCR